MKFETALVHTTGRLAGKIDLPIFLEEMPEPDWAKFQLQIDEDPGQLLPPGCLDHFDDSIVLYYFSRQIAKSGKLPHRLQWVGPAEDSENTIQRLDLEFQSVCELRQEITQSL